MSTQATISIYSKIIERTKGDYYPTKKEILNDLTDKGFKLGSRTFDRHLEALRNEFGIAVVYSQFKKGFFINRNETENLDAFINFLELILSSNIHAESLKDWKKAKDYISFESISNLKGIEHLNLLLDAVKNKKLISFSHQSFETDEPMNYQVVPYLLKEYQNRWYIIGVVEGKKGLRTFGIDRIRNLKLLDTHFIPNPKINPQKNFEHVIGLYYSDLEPEEVILSFTPQQGNYIRTLPLHHSQEILRDDEEEFRIKLYVVPNFELRQKILMLGDSVEVIEPVWFREEVIEEIRKALKQYL
jgi:predicted DNA-binding transcriptional regulator YafY